MSRHTILRYGAHAELALRIPPERLIAHCGLPPVHPLADVAATVAAALADPLDYPPLIQATVPGDRIAVVMSPDLPQQEAIATGMLQALLDAGSSADRITLVYAAKPSDALPQPSRLPRDLLGRVEVTYHDASDPLALAYLASSTDGHPIYLNRIICDADLVISAGCLRLTADSAVPCTSQGIYPTFADRRSQDRFQIPLSAMGPRQRTLLQREIEEAAWLLGARLAVQVVPGQGDAVLHALAGDWATVSRQGENLCRQAWSGQAARRGQLVVAGLAGSAPQQTWENLARALWGCLQAVDPDQGAIVLCTELTARPGPAVQQLLAAGSRADTEAELFTEHAPDAQVADCLWRAARQVPIYLLSGLSEELVSDLGLAFVESPDEINNLCQRHASCIVVSNAQHCWLTVQDEVAAS